MVWLWPCYYEQVAFYVLYAAFQAASTQVEEVHDWAAGMIQTNVELGYCI